MLQRSRVLGFSQDDNINLEDLRARLGKMSDDELLRWGTAARSMSNGNFGKPPRPIFVIQLKEARAEWRRRQTAKVAGESPAK